MNRNKLIHVSIPVRERSWERCQKWSEFPAGHLGGHLGECSGDFSEYFSADSFNYHERFSFSEYFSSTQGTCSLTSGMLSLGAYQFVDILLSFVEVGFLVRAISQFLGHET